MTVGTRREHAADECHACARRRRGCGAKRRERLTDCGGFAYAPGKWNIKELLCHTLDAERVFSYRALCFSRNDRTELPAFDENAYVPESNANALSLPEILAYTVNLRKTTIDLFSTFTPEMLARTGVANKTQLSVIGLGYITAGHQLHHMNVLSQRYLK